MIRVLKPGVLTTIQDLGRPGFAHLGVSPAGAADSVSFRIANLLVGNHANAPALEMTLIGPTLEFDSAMTVAISGARPGEPLPVNESFEVAAGTRLSVGPLLDGARAYLAVRGGMAVAETMGSGSTFLPAKVGGLEGRALKAGDRLDVDNKISGACRKLSPDFVGHRHMTDSGPIRVTPSLQQDWFDNDTIARFYRQIFLVSDQSNRSGLRLQAEPILAQRRGELLTEGIALGAIQVPPDGQPIILFVDQQTTGGYPKIANVISVDLPRIGQLRPRAAITFQPVSIPQAVELLRQQERSLREAFA